MDKHPVAACVREIMADRRTWTGTASDLLRAAADLASNDLSTVGGVTANVPPLPNTTLEWTAGAGFEVALLSRSADSSSFTSGPAISLRILARSLSEY
jgi:hypothetical protein